MRVAIGSTFDPLHNGHKKLLKTVYELSEGGELVIGVTSDKMARANKDRLVLPYNSRAEKIRQYMYNIMRGKCENDGIKRPIWHHLRCGY